MRAMAGRRLGLRGRERLLNVLAYALLILAIAIVFFPLLWMLTVSVRPNLEVTKIPPDWIPQVFTLEGYRKIFENKKFLIVFFNSMVISLIVTALSLFLGATAAYA